MGKSHGVDQGVFLLRSRTWMWFTPALLLSSQASLLAALSGRCGILLICLPGSVPSCCKSEAVSLNFLLELCYTSADEERILPITWSHWMSATNSCLLAYKYPKSSCNLSENFFKCLYWLTTNIKKEQRFPQIFGVSLKVLWGNRWRRMVSPAFERALVYLRQLAAHNSGWQTHYTPR